MSHLGREFLIHMAVMSNAYYSEDINRFSTAGSGFAVTVEVVPTSWIDCSRTVSRKSEMGSVIRGSRLWNPR